MAKFIGRLSKTGVAVETVRGTPVAPSIGFKWLELTLETKDTPTRNEQAFGNIYVGDDSTITELYGEITAKSKIHDISLGYFLRALFGTVNSVEKIAPNTGVYDHTFTVNALSNQHPSLTIAHKSPNEDERFPLAMIDSAKIEIDPSGYPTIEFAMMSQASVAASNTIVYQAERDFLSKQCTFKYADDIAGLGAATPTAIRKLSMEIKKNLFMEYVVGTNTPTDIMNQGLEIMGSITLVHDSTTFETIRNNETPKAYLIDFLHTDTIGTSANPEFKIQLNKVKISNYVVDRPTNEICEESFDFEAFYKLADAEGISAVLTNTQASY